MAQIRPSPGPTAPELGKPLKRAFFGRSVHLVAPDLIGTTLLVNGVGGIIVEVEAYHHTEPAAHSYRGPTPRNQVMFGPPGFVYVYRSYGIHWCVNFVCEKAGSASAVLIRALEPTHGIPAMRRRRGVHDERALCSGPGKLTEALGITITHNGLALDAPPFALHARTREAGDHCWCADRAYQSGRVAVAIWTERLKILEQAVLTARYTFAIPRRGSRPGC